MNAYVGGEMNVGADAGTVGKSDAHSLKKRYLIAGAIAIALIIGCRPHLTIVLFLIFPIFGKECLRKEFFSKEGIANTLCIIIPFLITGTGIMAYNYVRFGSPLDFGATYNLTGVDMTHRGIVPDRIFLGLWEYLFQPLSVSAKFPYVSAVAPHMGLATDYQGQVINEPLLGGFFAFNLVGLYVLRLKANRETLKQKRLYAFAVTSLIFALVVVSIDIQMVGMTLRYLSDFSYFIMMSVVVIILAECEKSQSQSAFRIILWLCAICIFINIFTLMADGRYRNLDSANRHVYYAIKYQLMSFLSIR
jgi:hypothetical protein